MTVITTIGTENRYPTRQSTESALLRRADPVVYGGPEDGPLTQAELDDYDQNGFIAAEELVTEEEVAGYREELDRLNTDARLKTDGRTVVAPDTREIRSVFEIHKISEVFGKLVRDPRLVGRARQILGSDVYVHQSRVTFKPGFDGRGLYWHSDFETWHAEDGMPAPRALSFSIALTPNYPTNGCLMIMPGSHRTFVSCVGETLEEHYRGSPRKQEIGMPDDVSLTTLAELYGIAHFPGPVGSATLFDSNCMHGSSDNITPYPQSYIFVAFNSVENTLVDPFGPGRPRPEYIASRDFTAV